MCPSLNFSRIHVIHSSVHSFMHTVTYCTLAAPQGQGKSHGQRKQKSFLWWAIHSSEFVCVCAPVQVCAWPSLQQSIANWEQWLPLGKGRNLGRSEYFSQVCNYVSLSCVHMCMNI